MSSRPLKILKTASAASRAIPLAALSPAAAAVGSLVGPRLLPDKAAMLDRHLRRVEAHRRANGPRSDSTATSADGFGSYARYWVESFRLPHVAKRQLDRGFSFVGYEHIERVRAKGVGPLVVLPHLGGWEWAAAWLGRVAEVPVTAVVERLEPDDVFEWFQSLRSSWGVDVVALGPEAFGQTIRAVRNGHVVCLPADRDVAGTGIDVEFFGEVTTLPVGPAIVALRTGAPLLPTAVFFAGSQRICRVGSPIDPAEVMAELTPQADGRPPRGRDRYRALTQRMATELERLITQAPEQWHLLEPNWPSDRLEV